MGFSPVSLQFVVLSFSGTVQFLSSQWVQRTFHHLDRFHVVCVVSLSHALNYSYCDRLGLSVNWFGSCLYPHLVHSAADLSFFG